MIGVINRENTVFKRSHSSEKCVQDEDKRCALSSMVMDKTLTPSPWTTLKWTTPKNNIPNKYHAKL